MRLSTSLLNDGLGQTELGDAVAEHAAGDVQRFEHGDLVAHARQIARTGQAGRARADDGDLVAVGFGRLGGLGGMFAMPVGDEALQTADTDGLALDAAHALGLALSLLRADATAHGGQRGLPVQHLERALDILVGDALNKGRNVDAHGAGADAGLVLAVQAAARFFDGHLVGIASGDFLENLVAIIGIQRGHGALFEAHILLSHVIQPPS